MTIETEELRFPLIPGQETPEDQPILQVTLKEEKPKKEIPVEERRYVVAWNATGENREMVIVYDKLNQKITYKVSTPSRFKAYPYIMKYYGKENCNAIGKQDLRRFE